MTNPNKLLPRFASASQWLAEEHPDAPRPDGNPSLNDYVVWVMEVANWYERNHFGFADITNEGLAGWAGSLGFIQGLDDLVEVTADLHSACLFVLESICTALGREG